MTVYYKLIRNNQECKKTLSTFYKMNYHWSINKPILYNKPKKHGIYIIGVNGLLYYSYKDCDFNEFINKILYYFNTDSADFIKLKFNNNLELG
jgi:hypothetical protein